MATESDPDPLAMLRNIGVSMEEAARNFEANLPALREALGLRTMQEFVEGVQAGMRKLNEQWSSQRVLGEVIDSYNQRMAEINGKGQ
jgi:hypothetical protein